MPRVGFGFPPVTPSGYAPSPMVGGYSVPTQFQAFSCVLTHKMRRVGHNFDRADWVPFLVIGRERNVAAGRPHARASRSVSQSVGVIAVRISALVC